MAKNQDNVRLYVTDEMRATLNRYAEAIYSLPLIYEEMFFADSTVMRSAIHLLADHRHLITNDDIQRYIEAMYESNWPETNNYSFMPETYQLLKDLAEDLNDNMDARLVWAGKPRMGLMIIIAVGFAADYAPQIIDMWRKDATTDPQAAGAPRRDP